MPLISRDEIKEGYVNTYGLKHDELPAKTNGLVSELFFEIVNHYFEGNISVVIEAAFQHHVWEPRITKIVELAHVWIILCSVDSAVAARRHLQRGLENPDREFYHGDKHVTHFRNTGEILSPASYAAPEFNVTTIEVSTKEEYVPSIEEIVKKIRRSKLTP